MYPSEFKILMINVTIITIIYVFSILCLSEYIIERERYIYTYIFITILHKIYNIYVLIINILLFPFLLIKYLKILKKFTFVMLFYDRET